MKKKLAMLLAGMMVVGTFTACGGAETATEETATEETATEETATEEAAEETEEATEETAEATEETEASAENIAIDKLSIAFVPSREPDEIITATEPLKELLTTEMATLGYDIGEVDITVGTSYEAVGEALSAGTADVGLIPGGTYVLYDDGCDVLLTATRNGLSIDSDDAKEWNDNAPTEGVDDQVTYYRALILAGPSEKGQEIAEKINNGEELTWEDVDSCNWSVMNSSSPAGYIYPSLWLQDNFGKNVTDLSHAVQSDSYGSAFARLASGQVDILCCYADARRDYEDKWSSEYGMTTSIWDDVQTVGVTEGIYNDTISVSKTSEIMDDDFKAALAQAFINIGETEEGKEVISIYSHNGYVLADSADYDGERKAQELIQTLNAQ
ncbi:MAG: PhnD/SsuA/transferrin family substrate-binding protein [Butyrivibrio sp.]|nr:PhnD/SsuA/transferrin family substrate-binding protein [Butyrivibrio sp.]